MTKCHVQYTWGGEKKDIININTHTQRNTHRDSETHTHLSEVSDVEQVESLKQLIPPHVEPFLTHTQERPDVLQTQELHTHTIHTHTPHTPYTHTDLDSVKTHHTLTLTETHTHSLTVRGVLAVRHLHSQFA